MTFDIEPLDATFGAVVRGPALVGLDDATFAGFYDAWLKYSLLIFPDQHLTTDAQIAFAKRFGDLEFELFAMSNVKDDGSLRTDDDDDLIKILKILKGNMGWHQDSTYMAVQAKGAVFSAYVVPKSGGETAWADASAGYEALDAATRDRIAGLSAYHSLYYSQLKAGYTRKEKDSEYIGYGFHGQEPPLRPLVKVHPETGRRTLTIGRHAYGIPGLSEAESEDLLQDLVDITCRPPRTYRHTWTPGDVVVWDNRCLLHQACPWDMTEPRIMYHTRLAGSPESEFAAPA